MGCFCVGLKHLEMQGMPAILTRKDKPGDPTLDARLEARGATQKGRCNGSGLFDSPAQSRAAGLVRAG
jgi:hypothetical protein